MTSRATPAAARQSESEVYAWTFPAGESTPTLCGRFRHSKNATGQGVGSFVYGARYLKQAGAVALDPVLLPLRSILFQSTANEGVFGVLADATPDDWGRYVIDRRHGTQAFPIGYWLHSQEDRVGNLCFSRSPDEAPNLAPPTSRALVDEAWMAISGMEAGRPLPPELEEKIRINTAMGGARPKLTVADESHQWLAKFPSNKDDPGLPVARIEAAMLDLAGLCKITAANALLHEVPATATQPAGVVLLVQRFDRSRDHRAEANGVAWLRDAYVSARTVLQSDPGVQAHHYSGSYSRLSKELTRWSGRPAACRHELFRRMVFNACVSNTDDHDRNLGFVASEDGSLYRLSPAFDIVPRLHNTQRRYQSLLIGDQGAEASIDNILSSCRDFNLSVQQAVDVIEEIQTIVHERWRTCLQDRGLDASAVQRLSLCFTPLPQNFERLASNADQMPRTGL